MRFNSHSELLGRHAFLSASKYHWVNYDMDKLVESYLLHRAAAKGTELHDFARRCIQLGIKLPRTRQTLNQYVNDAIGFRMTPEQVVYYSPNCYGTADAISFRKNVLRVHDYKSGVTPASFMQLMVYVAIFCLEYHLRPSEIEIEIRIYQEDDVKIHRPDPADIVHIIDRIITFDKKIEELRAEVTGD